MSAPDSGDEGKDAMVAANNLAITYFEQSKFQKAATIFEYVLQKYRPVPGSENDLMPVKVNLSAAYSELGKLDKAMEMQNDVLDTIRQDLGENHPAIINAMVLFSTILHMWTQRLGKGMTMDDTLLVLRLVKMKC
ncbi:nephrocystin-3 [Colletotrichum liriopes]|uniref:Nephrocystin-3 n=1 Tax=Colletotrichum liriopes TaxID=708192 RepID=A0AA37LXB1_9PEZI|nr:nephrocystin-3 [Colletotrichum liriopes]